jgi:hypothetical protein
MLRRVRHSFATLTPSKLAPADWRDLSGATWPQLHYTPPGAPRQRVSGSLQGAARAPFLPGAVGFLYAHTVPGHPAAGAVRMRLVPAPDPARFAAGADLLHADGRPWALPLPAVGAAAAYAPLRACLLREGAVSPDDIAAWARTRVPPRAQVVHARAPTFAVDFDACQRLRIHVAHGAHVARVSLRHFATVGLDRAEWPLWSGTQHSSCARRLTRMTLSQGPRSVRSSTSRRRRRSLCVSSALYNLLPRARSPRFRTPRCAPGGSCPRRAGSSCGGGARQTRSHTCSARGSLHITPYASLCRLPTGSRLSVSLDWMARRTRARTLSMANSPANSVFVG